MGNKRQRLARKKFKVVTGGDAAQKQNAESKVVEPSGKGSKQGKKELAGKKRKTAEGNEITDAAKPESAVFQEHGVKETERHGAPAQTKNSKSEAKSTGRNRTKFKTENATRSKNSESKHPLRMFGEGCFICRGTDHIAKLCSTKPTSDRKKICLLCRRIGHTLKNCPTSFQSQESKYCYNCGEDGHRLAECKKPLMDGGTRFAECFVCKKKGHLSKTCPINPNGIYPKGGCCKLCQGVTHLANDCPTRKLGGHGKLQISTAVAQASDLGGGGKRKVFQSGDDLGDDFMSDDETGDATVQALTYSSDDNAPEGALKTTSIKNTPKPKIKKEGRDSRKVKPATAKAVQHAYKVIQFQRPK